MRREGRWAEVGDIVIQKKSTSGMQRTEGFPIAGVVYERSERRGSDVVWIHWTPAAPADYSKEYGVLCANIHNMHTTYDIIKK